LENGVEKQNGAFHMRFLNNIEIAAYMLMEALFTIFK
jgi:hypothetical protein